jgi:DNA-directed RNA polymerase subunit RPC12/RpoP
MPTSADSTTRYRGGLSLVNKMVCENCGTVYYSAAAKTMIARGERCDSCGGKLVMADEPRPLRGPTPLHRRRQRAGDGPGGGAA